ncbi:MAG: hypothetical protein JXN61_15830 [Sedimentisphaerales bacterium]|nr:hypothetical protein [Sedimentisphaerales bacterium]
MKICIVKQSYVTEFTWESVRFTSARELLDKFILRSQNFSLLAGLRGDVWVVEDGAAISDTHRNLIDRAPRAIEALYKSHKAVSWSDIPWHEYDVVLSADQIIPDDIIRQYPDILWCYFEQEHTLPSFAKSAQKPDGAYDLFLNHHLSSPSELKNLPQSIAFPYTSNPDIMRELLSPARKPVVFLDSHMIRDRLENIEDAAAEYEKKCGLPVKYPRPWDFANSYECVGRKLTKKTSEHLAEMAGCRYFLLVRRGGIGQGAIEAASMGLIVISDSNEIYSRLVCHPACFVRPMNYDDALAKVKSIESAPGLQEQIRQFQDKALREHFWNKPVEVLRKGLRMKRDRKRANLAHPIDRSSSRPVMLKMPSSAVLKRISVIFSGRNDSYGGCFKDKLLAAWKRNSMEFYCRGIEVEWIFVEWNPLNEDYLSYTLAPLGFKCCVVSPLVHREICTNPNMSFMQFFAKNVGIRRAANHWLLITNADCVFGPEALDYIGGEQLDPGVIYRAERRDVEPGISSAPFSEMFRRTVRVHASQGGAHFTEAAGDFVLYNKESVGFGYDESITFSDVHVDGRFLLNWEIKSGVKDLSCFRFIGSVFKEDHPLTFKNTLNNKVNNHKGAMEWNKPLPYTTPANWGLADSEISELRPNIWHIGKPVEPLEHKEGAANIPVKPGDSVELFPKERHGSEQALPLEAQSQAITVFAMPKAFRGVFATIQRNAIGSWMQLRRRPEIILLGNDPGVAEFSRINGLRHIPGVRCNEFGTPLLNALFSTAQAAASNEICVYVNADIILMDDFAEAIESSARRFNQFLMIGRRWDIDISQEIDFGEATWRQRLTERVKGEGTHHAPTGIDYFAFKKGLWPEIPPMALGRNVWDNWLAREPLLAGRPVIDASGAVTIVHQNHDFSHIAGGKRSASFRIEQQRNIELAGNDRFLAFTSHATWELTAAGITLRPISEFLKDDNLSAALKCIESAYQQAPDAVKKQCEAIRRQINADFRVKLLFAARMELVSGSARNAAKLLLGSLEAEDRAAAEGLFRKGLQYLNDGDNSQAVEHLERAAMNCAMLPNVYYALAAAYARSGDMASAKRACRIELSIQPENRGAAELLDRIDQAANEYRLKMVNSI